MEIEGIRKEEVVQTKKTEVILESLDSLSENIHGLHNRIHSACERVGVLFDQSDDAKSSPPAYGSIPQIKDKVGGISDIIFECHEFMTELEKFV